MLVQFKCVFSISLGAGAAPTLVKSTAALGWMKKDFATQRTLSCGHGCIPVLLFGSMDIGGIAHPIPQRQKPPLGNGGFYKNESGGTCGGRTYDKRFKRVDALETFPMFAMFFRPHAVLVCSKLCRTSFLTAVRDGAWRYLNYTCHACLSVV